MSTGPQASPAGLFQASRPQLSLLKTPGVLRQSTDGERWLNGLATEPDACNVPLAIADASDGDWPYWWECPNGSGQTAATALTAETEGVKLIATGPAPIEGDPVTLWAGYQCSTQSLRRASEEDTRAKVLRKLNALLPAAIERELWTSQIATLAGFDNPALQDVATVTVLGGGGAYGFVTALGELEQALASRGNLAGRRMIHAQPRVVTAWRSQQLVGLSGDGTHLVTALGTVVVPGTGYTGGAPGAGAAANSYGTFASSWAYATGQVAVLIGEPGPVQRIDSGSVLRTTNDVQLRAEVPILVIFDPCLHVGVRVNLCDLYCGSGS